MTGLRLTFPAADTNGSAAGGSQFANEDSGTLIAGDGKEKGTVALLWKKAGDAGTGTEVLTIGFVRAQPALEIRWHSSMLLKNASLMGYYYWMLQNSDIALERAAGADTAAPHASGSSRLMPACRILRTRRSTVRWPVELPERSNGHRA